MATEEKIIKDAQFRKGLSIAFFNATNAAISMLTADKINMTSEQMEEYITKWRNWFLDEHKEYYANVIANVGEIYKSADAVKKIMESNSLEALKTVWLNLSEDERRDGEILKAKETMKKKYA
jgi:hypothetical protein